MWCLYVARAASAMRADGLPASWLTLVVIGSGVVALCVGVACTLGRGGDGQPGTMVASTAVLGMLGLRVLPLQGELAACDVSSRWTDATGLWGLLGLVGVAALCWGASDPWHRTAPPLFRTTRPGGVPRGPTSE